MRLSLAPMEGVVDHVMREIITSFGAIDFCTTEFIRVIDKLNPPHVFKKYCPELDNHGKTKSGVPVYVQLLGGQAQALAENASCADQLGAPGIDLNFGCPAKTVNRHDGGATLLKNPDRLFDIIQTVRKAVHPSKPVSAKVRLGFKDKGLCLEIASAVQSAGASHLTIHARTKSEGYRPPAHWEYIARMKEIVDIPVLANGDIWTVQDFLQCKKISGCKDFALGRGAVANPILARQIQTFTQTSSFPNLIWADFARHQLRDFFTLNLESRGEKFTVPRMKQWLKLLGRNFLPAHKAFEKIKTLKTAAQVENVLFSFEHKIYRSFSTNNLLNSNSLQIQSKHCGG